MHAHLARAWVLSPGLVLVLCLAPLAAASPVDEGEPLEAPASEEKAATKKIRAALKEYRKRVRDVEKEYYAIMLDATGIFDVVGADHIVAGATVSIPELIDAWDTVEAAIAACSDELYLDVDEGQILSGFEGSGGGVVRQAYASMEDTLCRTQVRIERRLGKLGKKADKACWPVVPLVRITGLQGGRSHGSPFTADAPAPVAATIVAAFDRSATGWFRNLQPGQVPVIRVDDDENPPFVDELELDESGSFTTENYLLTNGSPRTFTLGVRDAEGHETWLDEARIAARTWVVPGGPTSVAECPALSEGEASGSGTVTLDATEFVFELIAGDAITEKGVVTGIGTPPIAVQGSDPAATIAFALYNIDGQELSPGTLTVPLAGSAGADVIWVDETGTYTGGQGSGSVVVLAVAHDAPAQVSAIEFTFDVVLGDGVGGERILTGALEGCLAHFEPGS